MRVSKIPKDKDLKSIFSEMLDLLLYKQVLTEETAEGYFEWLLNQGLDAVNWNSDEKELTSELDNTNTVKRFNREINRDGIENDYFEGDSLGEFMVKFQKRVEQEHLTPEERRRVLTLFANYCYHFAEMHDINTSVKPTYRKYARWVDMDKEKKMGVPSFIKNLD